LNPQYGNTPGSPYGGPPMPQPVGPHAPIKQKNALGLIALVVSIIGLVFACIKGALIVGWVMLPIAFILGIVALFQSGKTKGTGTAAIIVSVVGVVIGAAVFTTVVTDSVHDALNGPSLSASPSSASSAPTTDQSNAANFAGSRENPYPIGETVGNHDWKVTLGSPHEAWPEISATNEFNDPWSSGLFQSPPSIREMPPGISRSVSPSSSSVRTTGPTATAVGSSPTRSAMSGTYTKTV
jgi:hypothetical protein